MNKTVAHNLVAKLSVAFVAVAMLFMMVSPAKAATAEEMQQMITDLLAQVAALQGQMGGSSSAAMCPYTWTRNLSMGATGADVMKLQQFLNSDADTRVSASGVGSVGMETEYFGPATAAAVSKFQVKHGIVAVGTGTFGPLTMAKANGLCVAASNGGNGGSNDDSNDDDSDDTSDLSGEADLKSFDIEDGDDADLEEGQTESSVQEFVVEFQDGDAMITRLDVNFDTTDSGDDVWDVLGEITLSVDGDEVASIDGSDEDNYQDDNDGDDVATLRLSGLDIRANEDDEVTIALGVEVQDNLDTPDQDVVVDVTGMRFVDGDDVTSTLTASEVDADEGSFSIAAEGSDDELIVKSSTEDPDATTLVVDEDTAKSDWYTAFAFDMDTDDSTNDIELNTVAVQVTTGTADADDVVQDAELVIDGVTYDDWDWNATADNVMTMSFDIDGDAVIDAGDRVTAELKLRFFGTDQGAQYDEGETVQVSASTTEFDAEGVEDVDATGSAVGETHTLRSAGLTLDAESVETETDTQGDNDTTGIFTIDFDVTALEGDFYVNDAASSSTVSSGVRFSVDGPNVGGASGVLSSTADDESGAFLVREGETETFTLTVTLEAEATGQYRVTLTELWFTENSDGTTSTDEILVAPASDYRTDYENVNA